MHALPPVFSGENYQAWVVKLKFYLEGCDLWEAIEEDYKVHPLPTNPTMSQTRTYKEKKNGKYKSKSCLFAPISATILVE